MGASQSTFRPPGAALTGSSYLGELGSEIQYEKSMGSSRFLKAIKARYRGNALVVKVFVKDPHMDLRPTSKRIAAERAALAECPNVLTYAQALATERAGYLVRQWAAGSLYDRISTRPFLSIIEKRWVAFQLLTALRDMHTRKISHGDIKSENVLVTSWNWVYVSDLAGTFKPTYLPEDDPADFSYFFDTSGRRTCYLAPERFYSADSEISRRKGQLEFGKSLGRVTEAMDVFSVGCVIAELLVEGSPPFTLSQLFKYRSSEYAIDPYLSQIEDTQLRELVRSMISLNPGDRHTFDHYLQENYGKIFPACFYDYFHDFIAGTNEISSPIPPAMSSSLGRQVPMAAGGSGATTPQLGGGSPLPPMLAQQLASQNTHAASISPATLPGQEAAVIQPTLSNNAEEIVNRIWTDFEIMQRHFVPSPGPGVSTVPNDTAQDRLGIIDVFYPVQLDIPGFDYPVKLGERKPPSQDGPALLVLSLICANIRNCNRPATLLRVLDLLLAVSQYVTDETKLDRALPFVVTLLQNDIAVVRAAALRTLTQILLLAETITPANATIFSEYILPNVTPIVQDTDECVRCVYAQSLAALSDCGQRYLDMTQAMKADGTFKLTRAHDFDGLPYEMSYDASLLDLQSQIQDQINTLLTDPSTSVQRALVANITPLCIFLGRSRASEVFSLMTTHLNNRDWRLRAAFYQSTIGLSTCIGSKSVDEYILPLSIQALADHEESVIARELNSLSTLAELGLYSKPRLWETLAMVVPLLAHPNTWLRTGAAAFIASSVKLLPQTDVWCSLYPALRKMLQADISNVDELSILNASVGPLSRAVFEAAVVWASKPSKSPFWQPRAAKAAGPLTKVIENQMKLPLLSEEDKAEMQKLQTLGMTEKDSFKLLAMREYISSIAVTRKGLSMLPSRTDQYADLASGQEIPLANLGIVPQNIIFSTTDTLASRMPSRLHHTDGWSRRWSNHDMPRPGSSLDLNRPNPGRSVSGSSTADALRRQLAFGNHSASSVHSLTGTSPRQPPTGRGAPTPSAPASSKENSSEASHTSAQRANLADSVNTIRPPASSSTTDVSSLNRQRSKVNMHGVEISRVSAAIGADTTHALGHMANETKALDNENTSGFSTPVQGALRSAVGLGRPEGRRFISTYEGDDPSIKQLLDRVYLDNYREPMPEFGSHVPAKVAHRRVLRTLTSRERVHKRPEGTLIAHLVEHTAAVTSIATSPDHVFFATGSEDGTVKIWDAARLEKNVTSRSRQTIQQGGKLTCITTLENTHCIASASDNGTIWVSRVDFQLTAGSIPRYGKQAVIRQHYVESTPGDFATCMLHFDTDSASKLVYATAQSRIVILDVRTLRTLEKYDNPTHLGPITCVCIDRKRAWLVVGTLSGTLALWDLRFGLLLRTWKAGDDAMPRAVLSCTVHKTRGKGRWVVVTVEGSDGFETWDIETGQRVELFRAVEATVSSSESGRAPSRRRTSSAATVKLQTAMDIRGMRDAELDPAVAIELLLKASSSTPNDGTSSLPVTSESESAIALHSFRFRSAGAGIRTILLGSDYSNAQENTVLAIGNLPTLAEVQNTSGAVGDPATPSRSSSNQTGWIISGGEDKRLRFWDLSNIERSSVVCGTEEGEERPAYSLSKLGQTATIYTETRQPIKAGNPNKRTQLVTANQQHLLKAHHNAITALALLELPFRCIVTADRSGVIKVWE